MVGLAHIAYPVDSNEEEIVKLLNEKVKWTSVSLSEVLKKGKRLEAAVFDVELKQKKHDLKNGKYPLVHLEGDDGFIETSFYPGRFKRLYCDEGSGYPFFLPSQINDIYPKPEKWISKLTQVPIDSLRVKKGMLLLTRSGTVGNVAIVSDTLDGLIFSDDVIRTTFRSEEELGYVYAYLKSDVGRSLFQTNQYGSVITHVEPEHLMETIIPNPPFYLKVKIHELVMESYRLRDESNNLIDEATRLMLGALDLPSIHQLRDEALNTRKDVTSFTVRMSELNGRLESTYHIPLYPTILKHIETKSTITKVGNPDISDGIKLPGRFKRTFVNEGFGHVFIGGKELYELDPSSKKFISSKRHSNRIKQELSITENTILITRSGTIGKVNIAPKHWNDWILNEHVIRVFAKQEIAGYLYIWLSSDYGKFLIQRNKFGSVVDEITCEQIADLPLPVLNNDDLKVRINQIALQANTLRYNAFLLEKKAIQTMNEEVLGL